MRLKAIRLYNYKKYGGKHEFSFEEGVTPVIKNNEEGKSTLVEAIKDCLCGTISSIAQKGNWYNNEKPYLQLTFEHEGRDFEIEIDCNRSSPKLRELPQGSPSDRDKKLKEILGKNFKDLINLIILEQENFSTKISPQIFEELSGVNRIDEIIKFINNIIGEKGGIKKTDKSSKYHDYLAELNSLKRELLEKETDYRQYEKDKLELEKLKKYKDEKENLFNKIELQLKILESLKNHKEIIKKCEEIEKAERDLEGINKQIIEKDQVRQKHEDSKKEITLEREKLEEQKKELDKILNERIRKDEKIKEIEKRINRLNLINQKHKKLEDETGQYIEKNLNILKEYYTQWNLYQRGTLKGSIFIEIDKIDKSIDLKVNDTLVSDTYKGEHKGRLNLEIPQKLKITLYGGSSDEIYKLVDKLEKEFKTLENLFHYVKKLEEIADLEREKSTILEGKKEEELIEERIVLQNEIREIDKKLVERQKTEERLKDLYEKDKKLSAELSALAKELEFLSSKKIEVEEQIKGLDRENLELKKGETEKIIDSLPFGEIKEHLNKDLSRLEKELDEIKIQRDYIDKEINKLREEIAKLEGKTSKILDKTSLETLREKVKKLENTIQKAQEYGEMLKYVKDILKVAKDRYWEDKLKKAKEKASEHFKKMTQKYEKIDWGSVENLQLKDSTSNLESLHVFEIIDNTLKERALKDLSAGARDQFLFACRLGLIEAIFGENKHFMVFDDPFANYDEERYTRAQEILNYLSKQGWQVLYLSWRKVSN